MEEFDASKHFAKLLSTGKFKIDRDGRVILNGIQMIMIPALTLAKLCKITPPKILREIGKYQVERGFKAYSKFFGLIIMQAASMLFKGVMDKAIDLMLKDFSCDGWGVFKIEKLDTKKREAIIINELNPVAKCYLRDFGRTNKPIDNYFVGLFEGASSILKRKIECKEIKCIACGDSACIFKLKFW